MDHSPRWQFSLMTLLLLTAVVAATSAAMSSPPSWISGLVLGFLSFAFPTAFVLVITTTTSPTYGVECSAIRPLAASFAHLFRVGGAIYWTFAGALGFFAVGVRWLIERTKIRRTQTGEKAA